jgi:hypothetical protein
VRLFAQDSQWGLILKPICNDTFRLALAAGNRDASRSALRGFSPDHSLTLTKVAIFCRARPVEIFSAHERVSAANAGPNRIVKRFVRPTSSTPGVNHVSFQS